MLFSLVAVVDKQRVLIIKCSKLNIWQSGRCILHVYFK